MHYDLVRRAQQVSCTSTGPVYSILFRNRESMSIQTVGTSLWGPFLATLHASHSRVPPLKSEFYERTMLRGPYCMGHTLNTESCPHMYCRPLDSNSAPTYIISTPASLTSQASQRSDAATAESETPPAPQAISAEVTPAATAAALACGEWHLLIHVATFNMNSTTPDELPDSLFGAWEKGADLYMFGSQESGSLPDWERLIAARLGQRWVRRSSRRMHTATCT